MSQVVTSATSHEVAQRYRIIRERSKAIFAIVTEHAYYDRPIALRHPIVFYEGHLPAFAFNTLIKLALKRPGIDDVYESLFARGIDPDSEATAKNPTDVWPARGDVQRYAAQAESLVFDALLDDAAGRSVLAREAVNTIIEHELMHQETLLYMFHELPYEKKRRVPALNGGAPASAGAFKKKEQIKIPAGMTTLGAPRGSIPFGWDNEFPALRVEVPAFEIDRFPVSNRDYLEYIEATTNAPPRFWTRINGEWFWRGMFEPIALPLDAPVYTTKNEAEGYARWRGKRIASEAEYHRAAFGTPHGEERAHPWGDQSPSSVHGNFDFVAWDPVANGSYPQGASAWGVEDFAGNGWEWTSSVFAGFPGFKPMPTYPEYSGDFFDGAHFVLKGASPATARELVRRSFRNWFRPNYPYIYAKFRCASCT